VCNDHSLDEIAAVIYGKYVAGRLYYEGFSASTNNFYNWGELLA